MFHPIGLGHELKTVVTAGRYSWVVYRWARISMPALATAVAQQCMRITGPYAIREQFKLPVGNLKGCRKN